MKHKQSRTILALCHAATAVRFVTVIGASLATLLLAVINPLLSTALAAGGAAAIVPVLQTTFTNPTPTSASDRFGAALAVMGNDRVVIGAPFYNNVGTAYVFDLNGALLYQFQSFLSGIQFGSSIATMPDNDLYVYIGAPGSQYLYWCNTNYSQGYVTRWSSTNLSDANDKFSASVAALGNNHLIVGAPASDLGSGNGSDIGAVFLYSSLDPNNYIPLTTITNPSTVLPSHSFGSSVAGVGDDRMLIGASGNPYNEKGKAYMFSTNGLLLTTFTNPVTNPTNAFSFGYSLVPLGGDRVLIGAPQGSWGGRAFLFSTNGALLTTFSNPTPKNTAPAADFFGVSVAAVGSDRVLIGARDAGANTGAAFLFSTNGTLLATLTNPTGATNDSFGITVAAVGSDRVLIGDIGDTSSSGGAVYLFSLVPTLAIQPTSTNTLAVSWPLFAPDFLLQQNTNALATGNWSNVTDTIQDDGTNKYIIVEPAVGNRFYRLSKP